MASYSLSGSGIQTLSAGVVAFHVTITTPPINPGNGGANPVDYYGIGFLRPGDAAAFWDPFAISGGPQWLPCPFGTTRVGYSLLNGAVILLAEVFAPSPLAVPLSQLPDVAFSSLNDLDRLQYSTTLAKWTNAAPPTGAFVPVITSPANGDLITYASPNWINAPPASGGGGGGSLTSVSNALGANVSCPTANTYYDGPSVSCVAGTWLLQSTITTLNSTGGGSITTLKMWNGTTVYAASECFVQFGSQNYSLSLVAVVVFASTTTVKCSVAFNNANGTIAWRTANNGTVSPASVLVGVKIA